MEPDVRGRGAQEMARFQDEEQDDEGRETPESHGKSLEGKGPALLTHMRWNKTKKRRTGF